MDADDADSCRCCCFCFFQAESMEAAVNPVASLNFKLKLRLRDASVLIRICRQQLPRFSTNTVERREYITTDDSWSYLEHDELRLRRQR